MRSLLYLALAIVLLDVATCFADAPSVSYIFPAGGQRGTTVNFHVGGHYLHDACPFEMTGAGIKATSELVRAEDTVWFEGPVIPLPDSQRKEDYPWEQNGHVSIAANAPLGFRRWRVWTSQGVTESMKFVVGNLPEVIEQEVDGDPIPTRVDLPVTINGRMFPREDVDIWTFKAEAGTSYTCEVMANRLGSPLDARLVVFDPSDRLVAENVDGKGVDSFLRFTAKQEGVYKVHIHDVNFGGLQHYVYRLSITDQPYVDYVYPLGGQRSTVSEFHLFGQATPQQAVLIDLPNTEEASFRDHLTVDGHETNEFTIELSDFPEFLEEQWSDAKTVSIPAAMNGRISKPGEVDSWWIELGKGEQVSLEVHAASLGSKLDSVLSVSDETEKELASNDDASSGQSDSSLVFKAPKDGRYRVAIRDNFGSRGDNAFGYRLYAKQVTDSQPDFELNLPVDALTLNRGSEIKLKVVAKRKNKFQEAITLNIDGLPPDVSISNNEIKAKKNDTQLTFKAEDNAKLQLARLTIRGTTTIENETIERVARKPAEGTHDSSRDHLLLSVALPTPFKVIGEFETRYAARGSTYSRHYTIDRGGYEGPITVRLAERQVRHLQGVTGPTILVPSGETEFDYPIKLAPWMEVGRTSRTAVMAVADIKDAHGTLHRVSYTSHAQNDQVIILVDPGQLAIRVDKKSIVAAPGSKHEIPFYIGRGQGLNDEVQINVVVPGHVKGVSAKAVTVSHDSQEGKLQFVFNESRLGPWNMPLVVRATTIRDGFPYTAETKLHVVDSDSRTAKDRIATTE